MINYADLNKIEPTYSKGHYSFNLLNESHGCSAGCSTGVSIYTCVEYQQPGNHEDQEGFFVLEGIGFVKIGENEINLYPGISFIVPAGVDHSIKSTSKEKGIKVFWFHAGIED
jgi:uncharacterized cupin superfamily protein